MVQKLNKCTYQVFALIYYGDVVNPFCFLCKLPNLHIWFWTNILIQYGKHHCALKNAKKWFCEILELLTFCAKVTICHSIRSNKDGLYIFKIFLKFHTGYAAIENVNSIDECRSKIVGIEFSIAICRPIFRLTCVARLATNGNQNFCKNRMFN